MATYGALAKQLARVRARVGITRRVTAHDLRRTTGRRVYELTHDLRDAQTVFGHADLATTTSYLQDIAKPLPRDILELAKTPPLTEKPQ